MLEPSDAVLIARERYIGIAVLVLAIFGPWTLLAVLTRRVRRRRALVAGLGVAPATLITVAGLVFTMCWYPGPPGVGAIGTVARRRSEPVIAALGTYRQRAGVYPDALDALVPELLPDTALAALRRVVGYPLEYRPSADRLTFELRFRYTGPGMNQCVWRDSSRTWACHGSF